jgi:hypothetical protein
LILYKYYGFSAGLSALKSSQLGFREPVSFNDPFELSFLDNAQGPGVKLNDLENKLNELKKSVAILSLTRSPCNPLMWAHYGENHTGFVIGYDVDTPFLTSDDYNLIPVERGDVVYTNTKTIHNLTPRSRDLLHKVYLASQGQDQDSLNKSEFENLARKIFLTKHASWVYEEEVRVVKSFLSMFETTDDYYSDPMRCWSTISKRVAPSMGLVQVPGLKIYSHKVDIKEVYLGVRNPLVQRQTEVSTDIDATISNKAEREKWKIYSLRMASGSWRLESDNQIASIFDLKKKTMGLLNDFSMSGKEALFLKDKLSRVEVNDQDNVEITNWNNELYFQKNREFE